MWKDELTKIYYESEADKRVSNIKVFIESLLKEQRENCAKEYDKSDSHYENFENILNAPEPQGEIK